MAMETGVTPLYGSPGGFVTQGKQGNRYFAQSSHSHFKPTPFVGCDFHHVSQPPISHSKGRVIWWKEGSFPFSGVLTVLG